VIDRRLTSRISQALSAQNGVTRVISYPLEGLRVLDFSRVLAGPFATRMLSDLGADVLKVEPPEGDSTRFFGQRSGEMSGYYIQQNIGKRNICLDLKADGARELIHKLVAEADVVVENYRPGIMDQFGIGWSDLKEVNPKLVMLSISGFGQVGPERDRAAYAGVLHAETGLIARQAAATGGHAADIQFSIADSYTSLHGLVGIFAALRMADQTGTGQHIDLAMLNVMHATDDFANYGLDGVWPLDNASHVWDAPEGGRIFLAGEMRWIWRVFSTRAGLEDPTPEGADLETKIAMRRDAIAKYILNFPTLDGLKAKLHEVNIAWGDVRDFGEASFSQPSAVAREVLVDIKDDEGNPRRTVQSPYRFSDAKSGITSASRAPRRGEHNTAALKDWLGLEDGTVESLLKTKVLLSEEEADL
jgi:crotonobetainyl-CoA:carnitine CoA-transferase CaiB-like acyl-CoA transferase